MKSLLVALVVQVGASAFAQVSPVPGADGYFVKDAADACTLNNIVSKKGADGSVTVQFGGCDGKVPDCLPIMPGWNCAVRLYEPRAEILNGT